MKIAFIRPRANLNQYIQNVPLNYIHLAAYLIERGHQPFIYDKILKTCDNAKVERELIENDIKVVGIGCMTCELPAALQEASELKKRFPQLKIVFGGAHPSADPEECLRSPDVDVVIVGEGEISLDQLLNSWEQKKTIQGIPGVWTKQDDLIFSGPPSPVPDVSTLPMGAYDLLDLKEYFKLDSPWHFPKSNRAVQFISSRGCPYRCSYCHTIHGKRFRGIPAETVIEQIATLVNKHRVEELMVVDDIFNFDLERAKTICRGLIDRNVKVHLQFPNGVRGDRFDEELVSLMKQAGTHFMAIAIETVSPAFQKLIRKNLKIDKAKQAIAWANKHKIEVSGFFMIGFPGETEEEVRETLNYAVSAPLDAIFISLVTPFKGTVLRQDMIDGRFGSLHQETLDNLNELFPVIESKALDKKKLKKMQMKAYWEFYLRSRPLLSLVKRTTNWKNLKKVFRAILRRVFIKRDISVN